MSDQQNPTKQLEILLNVVRSLTSRFEKSEDRLNNDIVKIEQRIDQLVDLVRSIATLQQQVTQHQKAITDLRTSIRINVESLTEAFQATDERNAEAVAQLLRKINTMLDEGEGGVATLSERLDRNESRFNGWLNRGFGAWAAFVLVIGSVQYGGTRVIEQLQNDRAVLIESTATLSTRVAELERRLIAAESK